MRKTVRFVIRLSFYPTSIFSLNQVLSHPLHFGRELNACQVNLINKGGKPPGPQIRKGTPYRRD